MGSRIVVNSSDNRSLVIDEETWEAWYGGQRLALTPTEARLLAAVMRRPGSVFSTHVLANQVWPGEALAPAEAERRLYPHASRLRHKLPTEWAYRVERMRKRGYILQPKPPV